MKIKLETSPWKNDFETIHDYITNTKTCLDINWNSKNVARNPGKRAVAKLFLNSLCGKFGRGQNMTQTEYVSNVRRWCQILLGDRH